MLAVEWPLQEDLALLKLGATMRAVRSRSFGGKARTRASGPTAGVKCVTVADGLTS